MLHPLRRRLTRRGELNNRGQRSIDSAPEATRIERRRTTRFRRRFSCRLVARTVVNGRHRRKARLRQQEGAHAAAAIRPPADVTNETAATGNGDCVNTGGVKECGNDDSSTTDGRRDKRLARLRRRLVTRTLFYGL